LTVTILRIVHLEQLSFLFMRGLLHAIAISGALAQETVVGAGFVQEVSGRDAGPSAFLDPSQLPEIYLDEAKGATNFTTEIASSILQVAATSESSGTRSASSAAAAGTSDVDVTVTHAVIDHATITGALSELEAIPVDESQTNDFESGAIQTVGERKISSEHQNLHAISLHCYFSHVRHLTSTRIGEPIVINNVQCSKNLTRKGSAAAAPPLNLTVARSQCQEVVSLLTSAHSS
jgi:hypothetical protein